MTEVKRIGFLNSFWFKLFLCALMTLDHIYDRFPGQPMWFHTVSRVVAPAFVYLVAEGMAYTSNRSRYIGRMLGWGGGMLVGNIILSALYGQIIDNSVLISLGLTGAAIACGDRWRQDWAQVKWPLALLGLFAVSIVFEGAFLCPALGLIFYFLRERRVAMWLAFGAVSVLFSLLFRVPVQLYMLFTPLAVLLYNGKRGPGGPLAKNFFYLYYPAHIWGLFVLSQYIGR